MDDFSEVVTDQRERELDALEMVDRLVVHALDRRDPRLAEWRRLAKRMAAMTTCDPGPVPTRIDAQRSHRRSKAPRVGVKGGTSTTNESEEAAKVWKSLANACHVPSHAAEVPASE